MTKNNVLAVVEARDGQLRGVSRELTSVARTTADALGGAVHVFAAGPPGTAAAVGELARYGADRLVAAESEELATSGPSAHAAVLARHVRSNAYAAVLFAATTSARTWPEDGGVAGRAPPLRRDGAVG